ncbi:MAG: fibronectin type III domain-containing protein, partial [bacterium]
KDMFVAKYQVDRRSPIAPDSLIATALSSRKILVTWRLNSKNEDNVQVFRKSEHEQRFSLHIELPANSTSYCDSTVVPDTSYTYFVIAININGPSDPSEEDGATSVAAPTDLAAPTAAAFSVQLSWKDRSGKENGYRVRRSKAPETEPNELVAELGINEEKFTDTNVQPNTTYFYRVWAFRGADHGESDPSNRLQIATANINLTWHTAITLSDTCDGKHTLNIGQGQTATDGLDALLGESDSPLLSTGIFDAKLLLGAGLFSKNDFRPDGVPVITWRINIQQGDCGYPAELSWESATMPAGAFRLKDVFSDGGQFDIDMKTQNSLSIDNTAITQIIIEYQQDVSAVDDVSATPGDFTLHPNYPNPFNPSTTITYEIAQPATVLLTIFDPMGRKIRALFHGRQASGLHSIEWDGRDDSGSIVSSGVYFYRLQTIGTSAQQTRKMVFMQ